MSSAEPTEQQFVLVSAEGLRRLARLADVSEIVPMMELQSVGRALGACRGMMNLRGEVVPVFDFGAGSRSSSQFILLLHSAQGLIGLTVDAVEEVVAIPSAQVSSRPVGAGKVMFVARLEGEILPILDAAEVIGHGG